VSYEPIQAKQNIPAQTVQVPTLATNNVVIESRNPINPTGSPQTSSTQNTFAGIPRSSFDRNKLPSEVRRIRTEVVVVQGQPQRTETSYPNIGYDQNRPQFIPTVQQQPTQVIKPPMNANIMSPPPKRVVEIFHSPEKSPDRLSERRELSPPIYRQVVVTQAHPTQQPIQAPRPITTYNPLDQLSRVVLTHPHPQLAPQPQPSPSITPTGPVHSLFLTPTTLTLHTPSSLLHYTISPSPPSATLSSSNKVIANVICALQSSTIAIYCSATMSLSVCSMTIPMRSIIDARVEGEEAVGLYPWDDWRISRGSESSPRVFLATRNYCLLALEAREKVGWLTKLKYHGFWPSSSKLLHASYNQSFNQITGISTSSQGLITVSIVSEVGTSTQEMVHVDLEQPEECLGVVDIAGGERIVMAVTLQARSSLGNTVKLVKLKCLQCTPSQVTVTAEKVLLGVIASANTQILRIPSTNTLMVSSNGTVHPIQYSFVQESFTQLSPIQVFPQGEIGSFTANSTYIAAVNSSKSPESAKILPHSIQLK